MKKLLLIVFITISLLNNTQAQVDHGSYDANELIGEFGVTVGVAHYFGDLNTRAGLNRPKPAIGAF